MHLRGFGKYECESVEDFDEDDRSGFGILDMRDGLEYMLMGEIHGSQGMNR